MTKHVKMKSPSDKDLRQNPHIGGSKGLRMSGTDPDELESFEGAATFEGDRENDTTAYGGIDEIKRAGAPHRNGGRMKRAPRPVQGEQTHLQRLRNLERRRDDDVPAGPERYSAPKREAAPKSGRKHFGAGVKGRGMGGGALQDARREQIPENMVLSNRDKSLHSRARGLDSKAVQSAQLQDHAANRHDDENI